MWSFLIGARERNKEGNKKRQLEDRQNPLKEREKESLSVRERECVREREIDGKGGGRRETANKIYTEDLTRRRYTNVKEK